MVKFKSLAAFASLLLLFGVFVAGCSSFGIARLPDKSQLFVSQSSEEGFILAGDLSYPYQPIGYLAVNSMLFNGAAMNPCADQLGGTYKVLEKVISGQLYDKAKNEMGADGLIGLTWVVTPGLFTYVEVRGLAVKRK